MDNFLEIGNGEHLLNLAEIMYVDLTLDEHGEQSQMLVVMKNGKTFVIEDNIIGVFEDIKTAVLI